MVQLLGRILLHSFPLTIFLESGIYDNDDDSADIRRLTAVITQDHPASEAGAR